ncbi:unannotated protein [freshwater metagenome]|nr:hypothetical protein [Actinomycetota bacterium]
MQIGYQNDRSANDGLLRDLVDDPIPSDCCSARTRTQSEFFCRNVFPLRRRTATSTAVLGKLTHAMARTSGTRS